ncbi:MAG TPA: hypothetical protein VF198_08410, partial [Vicinamibacterales bacterium]
MRASSVSTAILVFLCAGDVAAQQAGHLQVGQPVTTVLAAGDTLRYELDLPDGHFVAGRVEQDVVDVAVTVTGPDGERVQRASRLGRDAPEIFAFTTRAAGRYRIDVAPVNGAGGPVRVQLTRSEPVASTPEGKVDQAAAYLAEDTPGAVVGVIRNGELVFVKAYGAANLTYGIPFTPETPTNIG